MAKVAATAAEQTSTHYDHDDFLPFAEAMQERFAALTAGGAPLFTVDANGLWDQYLGGFDDPVERQQHNCTCCKNFIRHYGALVTIDDAGIHHSALWDESKVPAFFKKATANLQKAVAKAPVSGIFVSSDAVWGTARTGIWNHFSLTPSSNILHRNRINAPHQVMAQKKQDFGTLSHGLADYSRDVVAAAVNLLESESLYRSEKVIAPARFLLQLHGAYQGNNARRKANLIWKATATAPVGFCTPRSSMIGTLLDDLKDGMSVDLVKSRFRAKMDPLQYQRPQSAPSVGNIAAAEKLVEKLGIANSLKRRFARLEEIETIWTPAPLKPEPATGGVFGHLKPKGAAAKPDFIAPAQNVTWVKFLKTVAPKAISMEVQLSGSNSDFTALVTAIDPNSPPILQWDKEDKRNPFSWYLYTGGSSARSWNLSTASWVKVNEISLKPSLWGREPDAEDNHGKGALFVLDGCRDTRNSGLALFPEILKSELHEVRKTIESFSNNGTLEGKEEASACGLLCGPKGLGSVVRVETELGRADYRIDRWD